MATLEPASPKVTLRDLVARITPENLHGEQDWGKPVGREVGDCCWGFRVPKKELQECF